MEQPIDVTPLVKKQLGEILFALIEAQALAQLQADRITALSRENNELMRSQDASRANSGS